MGVFGSYRRKAAVAASGEVVGVRVSGAGLELPGPGGDPLHILIGGTTGSGKSVLQRAYIGSVAGRDDVALLCLDPKRVELGLWEPRATVVAKSIPECTSVLVMLWREVQRRLDVMDAAKVAEWHPRLGGPYLAAAVDELTEVVAPDGDKVAELMLRSEDHVPGSKAFKEDARALREALQAAGQGQKAQGVFLSSLARICRSSGVQIVSATQYPESSVIDPQYRANMACRVLLRVPSQEMVDVILGHGQAGDVTPDSIPIRERGGCWVAGLEGRPFRGRGFWVSPEDAAARAVETAHLRWGMSEVFVGQDVDGEAGAPDDRREAGAEADPVEALPPATPLRLLTPLGDRS